MNEQFLATVEAALARAGALRAGATLLVALSGGADSVALLRAVCALRERHGFCVRAAHVEHGLRGGASQADADFCESLCQTLRVPFTCDHAKLTGDMAAAGVEARARAARYALLLQRARECNADALLLAHHRDDQAETVLAHLIRGSGARGLGGMREITRRDGVPVVRPLLTLGKQEVLAALDGLPYRTDETNLTPCCQRNRLRAQVLPLLQLENPRAAEHIAQSAALLAMDDAYLSELGAALLETALWNAPPLCCLDAATVLRAPAPVAARALRGFALLGMAALALGSADAGELSAGNTLALAALAHAPAGTALNLPQGLCALRGKTHLHLTRMGGAPLAPAPAPAPVALHTGLREAALDVYRFTLTPYAPQTAAPPDGLRGVVLPNAALARCTLRLANAGDRIAPFGAKGGKPLRRYFTDRKVDAPFRPAVPLLCEGGNVLWACGVGAAEATRLTDAPSTLITVQSPLPWL